MLYSFPSCIVKSLLKNLSVDEAGFRLTVYKVLISAAVIKNYKNL